MTAKSLVLEDNREFSSILLFGCVSPPQQSNLIRLLSCSNDLNHCHDDSLTS